MNDASAEAQPPSEHQELAQEASHEPALDHEALAEPPDRQDGMISRAQAAEVGCQQHDIPLPPTS